MPFGVFVPWSAVTGRPVMRSPSVLPVAPGWPHEAIWNWASSLFWKFWFLFACSTLAPNLMAWVLRTLVRLSAIWMLLLWAKRGFPAAFRLAMPWSPQLLMLTGA